jgi:hypothetical protein
MRKFVAVLAMLCLGMPALAAEIGGVKLDDSTTVSGQKLVLNGGGVRTKFIVKVYVASLYLPAKSVDLKAVLAKGPRRIQMNLLRDVSADQFVDALLEGLKDNNSAAELAAVKAQTEQLVQIMKAFKEVKEKDVVTLDFVDDATRIGLNGADRGSIPGEAFNQALTRIWLGEHPVQDDLKKAMLGR